MSQNERREWSGLPPELLAKIAENLSEMSDHHRFRSVCPAWRATPQIRLPKQIPWLHLPYSPSTESRYFYSLSEDRVYKLPLPDGLGSNLFGSGKGKLLSIKGLKPISTMLLDPFTRTSWQLPPIHDVRPSPFYKGAERLVWDQSDSTVVVMDSINKQRGDYLFYSHPGDLVWSMVNLRTKPANKSVSSIAFHNQKVYVVEEGTCETTILDGENLDVLFEIPPPVEGRESIGRLVESSRGLLLLVAHATHNCFFYDGLRSCKVFHLSHNGDVYEWSEVADIGDDAIFMDLSHGFLVQVPQNSPIKKNCVYYAQMKDPRLSVFDLADHSYKQLEGRLNGLLQGTSSNFSPCWIVPN